MKRFISIVVLAALASLLIGCGGSKQAGSTPPPSYPQISGSWEIIASSTNSTGNPGSSQTRLETVLAQNEGNLSAQNTLLFGVNFYDATNDYTAGNFLFSPGGDCNSFTGGETVVSLTGTIDAQNNFTFNLIENGVPPFSGTGTLQSDGSLTGTYSGGGNVCPDSGTFVAKPAVSLAGNYQVATNWPSNWPSLTVSLAENPSGVITGQLNDGLDSAFPINGQVYGNGGQVSGTVVTGPNAGNSFTYSILLVYDEQNAPLLLAVSDTGFYDLEVLSKQ